MPISALDAVSPAIRHTIQQLFRPFRFGVWVRLAVLGLLTAEFSGGGSSGQAMRSDGGSSGASGFFWPQQFPIETLLFAVSVAILGVMLGLSLLYVSSVCRFILFDAVLRDLYRLREGFRRWYLAGWSFFLWQLALATMVVLFLVVVIGVPLLIALTAGVFDGGATPWGLAFALIAVVFLLVIPFFVAVAVISLFARDFVLPIMALEDRRIIAAWRSFLPRLRAEWLSYLGYVLCKIVLSIVSAFLFGILALFLIVLPLLLLGVVGAVIVFAGAFAGLEWNVFSVALVALIGLGVVLIVMALFAFVSTPAVVFFQAYRIHFFGSRYSLLHEALVDGPFPPEP